MAWFRSVLLGVALTGVAAACTLIDPLDDVSRGAKSTPEKKDAGSSSGSSSSGATGDDDDVVNSSSSSSTSSGSPGSSCAGTSEKEPNNDLGTGSPLNANDLTFCGTLKGGAADVDRWRFTNTTGKNLQVILTITADSDISYVAQSGTNTTGGGAGGSNITSLGTGETFALTINAPAGATQDIGYQVVFTVN